MSFRFQLIILVLAVVALGATGVGWVALDNQRSQAVRDRVERGLVLSDLMAPGFAEPLMRLETSEVTEGLAELRARGGVKDAMVLDDDRGVLVDCLVDSERLGVYQPFVGRPVEDVEVPSGVEAIWVGRDVLVRTPIRYEDTQVGLLLIRLEAIDAAFVDDAQTLLMAGLAAVVVGLGVVFIFASRWGGRMLRIRYAMERVHAGHLDVQVPLDGSGDLRALAIYTNAVAAQFSETTAVKNFFDNVLASMVDTLIVVDTDAVIFAVNQATLDLLGYQEEQLIGQPASLVCIDEGYQLTGTRLEHLLGDGSKHDHELQYRTADGKLVPISFSGSAIRNAEGISTGYVCIGTDITERTMAAAERQRLNEQLVDASRHAGMAEVATGVLHNVGNVLNSVNVSTGLVSEMVGRSRLSRLNQVVSLMQENKDDLGTFLSEDNRGKMVPSYLEQLAAHLTTDQSEVMGELENLNRSIGHIRDIIGTQQTLAKSSGVIEKVTVDELVESVVRMNQTKIVENDVRVHQDIGSIPTLATDKHKVLQIMMNLVSNAIDAMKDVPIGHRELYVRAMVDDTSGGEACVEGDGDAARDVVLVEIADTGPGIPEEDVTRVFTHGFTTKSSGHGFGLHSAALAAKELQGALNVVEDSRVCGATFALRLPIEQKETVR